MSNTKKNKSITLSPAAVEILRNLIENAFLDENGVSEEVYVDICDLADEAEELGLGKFLRQTDSTDGRYYLPESYAEERQESDPNEDGFHDINDEG